MLCDCSKALVVETCPQEGLMLSTHRRHQLRGPSPAAVCHCSADTLLLAAKFLSSVALQCPWILNGEVLCFSNSCCSQIGNVAVAGCGVRGGAALTCLRCS